MKLKAREILFGGLALTQLALVLASVMRVEPAPQGLGRALGYYGYLSGSSAKYGFFAPGVGSQLRGRFEAIDGDGRRVTEALETGQSHEANLRIGNLLGWFWSQGSDVHIQRALAASWAGKIFGRNPWATKVSVQLDTYQLPSMEEYRQGQRPNWKPYYEAKFVRRSGS